MNLTTLAKLHLGIWGDCNLKIICDNITSDNVKIGKEIEFNANGIIKIKAGEKLPLNGYFIKIKEINLTKKVVIFK